MKPSVVYPENLIGVLKPHLKAWCSETWSASLVKHLSFFLSFFFLWRSSVPIQRIGESSSYFVIILRKLMDSQKLPGLYVSLRTYWRRPHIKTCNRGTKHKQAREYLTFNPEESQVGEVPACKRQNHGAKEMYGLLQGVKNGQKAAVVFFGCIYLYTFVRMCKLNKSPLFLLQNIGICSVFKRGRGVTATATPTKFLSKIGKS